MILLVGLGNPGKKYAKTRHNIGFMALEALADNLKLKFSYRSKFKADIAKGKIDSQNIVLAKPNTYMNLSGQTVVALAGFYKIKSSNIWLVYDDIDIEYGFIRIKPFGSAAGHKGVNSIISGLGTQKLPRFRVGIKPSAEEAGKARYHKKTTSRFVLGSFSPEQNKILSGVIKQAVNAIVLAVKKGLPEAMNKYN